MYVYLLFYYFIYLSYIFIYKYFYLFITVFCGMDSRMAVGVG